MLFEENEEFEIPDQHYEEMVDQEDEELMVEEQEDEEQEVNSNEDEKLEVDIE